MIDCIDCEFSRIINGYIHCDWFDDEAYEDCPFEEVEGEKGYLEIFKYFTGFEKKSQSRRSFELSFAKN